MKKRSEVRPFCWRVSVSLSDQVYTALMFLVNFAIKVFRLLSTDSSTMVYQLLLATNKNSRAERRSITSFAESQTEGTGDFAENEQYGKVCYTEYLCPHAVLVFSISLVDFSSIMVSAIL